MDSGGTRGSRVRAGVNVDVVFVFRFFRYFVVLIGEFLWGVGRIVSVCLCI